MTKLQQLTILGLICLCAYQTAFAQDPIYFGKAKVEYTDAQINTAAICDIIDQWQIHIETETPAKNSLEARYHALNNEQRQTTIKNLGCDQDDITLPMLEVNAAVAIAFDQFIQKLSEDVTDEMINDSPASEDLAFNNQIRLSIAKSWPLPIDEEITAAQNMVICGFLHGQVQQVESFKYQMGVGSIPAYTDLGLLSAAAHGLELRYQCQGYRTRFYNSKDEIFGAIEDEIDRR
ncbi:MAG: hypothetical protein KDK51_06885 [Deltaproteobacteria bacterium]|nr:hypothetical protein [Deltaproteobacteria bacterium]